MRSSESFRTTEHGATVPVRGALCESQFALISEEKTLGLAEASFRRKRGEVCHV